MRDQIRETLMQRIMNCDYQPGERLIELNLAREFNVSQAPVREALRELETMGLIDSERYCGSRVRQINMDEATEAYELRATLEQRAAELAVPCPQDMLIDLAQTLDNMHRTAASSDTIHYAQHAVHFHRCIVEQSGNRLLLRTWENLHIDLRVHFAAIQVGNELPNYAHAHVAILEALTNNDGALAGKLIRQLFDLVARSMQAT